MRARQGFGNGLGLPDSASSEPASDRTGDEAHSITQRQSVEIRLPPPPATRPRRGSPASGTMQAARARNGPRTGARREVVTIGHQLGSARKTRGR